MAICAPLRTLSICSGIGGLDLGVKFACPEARTVCYVERDAYAASVLVARMEGETLDRAPIWSDLLAFPVELYRGRVDLVVGGIPCQPYSAAGKELGAEDGRDLWPATARLIRRTGARALFLENVGRFASHKDGLARVLKDLASVGWNAQWGVFSCGALGAPHRRERLFLLAYASSFKLWLESRRELGASGACASFDGRIGEELADASGEPTTGWRPSEGRIDHAELPGLREELADASSPRRQRAAGKEREPSMPLERSESVDPRGSRRAAQGVGLADALRSGLESQRAGTTQPQVAEPSSIGHGMARARGHETAFGVGLADTESARLSRSERQGDYAEPRPRSEELANADGAGREAVWGFSQEPSPTGPDRLWPPGQEPDRWRGIDARYHPAAPKHDLRGVADGVPRWVVESNRYRTDRLRCLGNAVSPPVAAVAWIELTRRVLAQ